MEMKLGSLKTQEEAIAFAVVLLRFCSFYVSYLRISSLRARVTLLARQGWRFFFLLLE